METENPILQKIQEKESAMAKALADAAQLELQIKTLRQTLEMLEPTEYEKYLKAKAENQPSATANKEAISVGASSTSAPEKNPKGTLTPAILNVASDGKIRSIDDVLEDVNKQMSVPTTRDSVRATLNHLKSVGKIHSPGYGRYQGIDKKGESLSGSNTEAFNLQPSPDQGL